MNEQEKYYGEIRAKAFEATKKISGRLISGKGLGRELGLRWLD